MVLKVQTFKKPEDAEAFLKGLDLRMSKQQNSQILVIATGQCTEQTMRSIENALNALLPKASYSEPGEEASPFQPLLFQRNAETNELFVMGSTQFPRAGTRLIKGLENKKFPVTALGLDEGRKLFL